MDDLKLFAKNDDQIDSLVNEVILLNEGNEGNIILDFNWKAVKRKYIRRVWNILKLQLNGGNIILDFNWKAVSIVRYGAGMESQAEQR